MKKRKIPMRKSVVSGEMKPKKEMLRVVRPKEGDVFIDLTGKAAGRGAYVCNDPACIRKLKKGRLLNKIFSAEIPAEVYEKIEEDFLAKK